VARYARVNTLPPVDHLRDREIGSDAYERIGIASRHAFDVAEQTQHLERRRAHRKVEIFIEAVDDPRIGRFEQR
jgi:hypothetical protein